MGVARRFCMFGKQSQQSEQGAEQEAGCPGPVPGGNIQPIPLAGGGEIMEGSKQPMWPSLLLAHSFLKYCP